MSKGISIPQNTCTQRNGNGLYGREWIKHRTGVATDGASKKRFWQYETESGKSYTETETDQIAIEGCRKYVFRNLGVKEGEYSYYYKHRK